MDAHAVPRGRTGNLTRYNLQYSMGLRTSGINFQFDTFQTSGLIQRRSPAQNYAFVLIIQPSLNDKNQERPVHITPALFLVPKSCVVRQVD